MDLSIFLVQGEGTKCPDTYYKTYIIFLHESFALNLNSDTLCFKEWYMTYVDN